MNFATFVIRTPNHFQGHLVHCPMSFDFELFDQYTITIKHSNQKVLIGNFSEKKQKRNRNNSIGEKNSPSKRQRLESEQSQEEIEEIKPDEIEEEPVVVKQINDPG